MKILFYSDVHIAPYNEFSKPTKVGSTVRTNDLIKTSEWISNKILDLQPDMVIDGGDFYHSAVSVNPIITRCGYNFVDNIQSACKKLNIELIMNVGNHDILSEGLHALDAYKWVCQVIDKPLILNDIIIVPFHNDISKVYSTINESNCSIAVIHQDLLGGIMQGAIVSNVGINIKNIDRITFSGHYHKSQTLKSKNSSLHVIGSVMSNHFGDSPYDSHGLLLYDTMNNHISRFINPNSPRYESLTLESKSDLHKIVDIDQKRMTYLRLLYSNHLLPDLNKIDLSEFRGYRKSSIKTDIVIPSETWSHTALPIDVFSHYVNDSDTDLDKSKLLSIGCKIINSAS